MFKQQPKIYLKTHLTREIYLFKDFQSKEFQSFVAKQNAKHIIGIPKILFKGRFIFIKLHKLQCLPHFNVNGKKKI